MDIYAYYRSFYEVLQNGVKGLCVAQHNWESEGNYTSQCVQHGEPERNSRVSHILAQQASIELQNEFLATFKSSHKLHEIRYAKNILSISEY